MGKTSLVRLAVIDWCRERGRVLLSSKPGIGAVSDALQVRSGKDRECTAVVAGSLIVKTARFAIFDF